VERGATRARVKSVSIQEENEKQKQNEKQKEKVKQNEKGE
jgi:hypothetical protein